jgi:hypothetical protein
MMLGNRPESPRPVYLAAAPVRVRPTAAASSLIALLTILLAALLAATLASAMLAGCGAGATDQNEPNDELGDATVLTPGTPLDGVIGGADDGDVFHCDAPAAEGAGGDATPQAGTSGDETAHPFVVTVRTDAPGDIELQVGASIPGVWEGITWPGWESVVKDDRLEVEGTLRKGTVLAFLKGDSGTEYSIEIVWE